MFRTSKGVPIPSVNMTLTGPSSVGTQTSATGAFSFVVAPGSYSLSFNSCCSVTPDYPQQIGSGIFTVNLASTLTQDVVIPVTSAHVTVIGPNGNPVPGTAVDPVSYGVNNVPLWPGGPTGNLANYGGCCGDHPTTGADGTVTLGLIAANPVTLRATPPTSLHLSQAVATNLDARTDTNTVVIMKIDTAAVTSIAVTPANPHAPQGTTKQFAATATYTDGSTQDITASVSWSSSSTATATVNVNGLATAITPGPTTITASVGSVSGQTVLTVDPRVLTSIAVTPQNPTVPRGSTRQFTATGTYSDGSTADLANSATWVSSGTPVATVSSSGLATARALGIATISATVGSVSGSSDMTVGPSPLTIQAPSLTFTYGDTIPTSFTPTYIGLLNGDTQTATPATCTSIAHTGSGVGTYSITCSGAVDSNYAINYSVQPLQVTPRPLVIQPVGTQTYGSPTTVTASYDGLAPGDTGPATPPTCTASGSISCSGAADPNYTITYAAGTLTITPAPLAIQAPSLSVPLGAAVPSSFTPTYSGFVNGDTAIATPPTCTSTGHTGSPMGTYPVTCSGAADPNYTITYTDGTLTIGAAALTSIAVTPANPSVAKGLTQQFIATGTYTDGSNADLTSSATWASSNTTTATITSFGLASATAAGTTTISASFASLVGSTPLTVTGPVLASIAVTPADPTLAKGLTRQFTATGTYTDGSTGYLTSAVTWASSSTATATISAGGLSMAVSPGTSTLSATLGSVVGSTTLTVVPATLASIVVTPSNPTVIKDQSQQFTAIGTYTDAITVNLTASAMWASSSTAIATITAGGLASATAAGTTTISATSGSVMGTTVLTVERATPAIDWHDPAPITYGTALSSTQLNATSPVAGTFAYSPIAGTVLGAGTGQALTVIFTPTDTANYTSATATVHVDVNKATPAISWVDPADIVYGTALNTNQLNATASVPGTFAYTPAGGTVLGAAANQALTVAFSPTDTANYTTASATAHITVNRATPAITWADPAPITYGSALDATQLNATSPVAGTFVYAPPSGTLLGAGTNQALTVTFTPTDTANYTTASATAHITVNRATPAITWADPAPITYGSALGATQLNATSPVAGTFVYAPPSGTLLGAGTNQALTVTLTPTDTANYTTASATAHITVNRATPAITWADPAPITYGSALSATQLNATSPVAGTFAYSPTAGTVLGAGLGRPLTATFTPTDTANYTSSTATVHIDVNKATPPITWSDPAPITYGTPLSSSQLNATSPVPGTFTYTPPLGTVLGAGSNQALMVTFTPTDTANYTTAPATVQITVNKATPAITWTDPADITYGTSLSSTQLNATSPVAGSFTYAPPAGTVLGAGPAQTLTVTFTPTDSANYTAATKIVYITVTRVALKVTADNTTKVYGQPNPVFTVSYLGFVNGDTPTSLGGTLAFATLATSGSAVGTYVVTPSGLTSPNYTITFAPGTLSVTKAPLSVTADNKTKVYGQANPTFTASYTGLVAGDTPTSLGGTLAFATPATTASSVDNYPITPSGLTSSNYTITFVPGSLSVTKAALTVAADDKTRPYGQANPALTYKIAGFVNGDTAGVVTGAPALSTAAVQFSNVGTYPITVAPGTLAAVNYSFTVVNGTLTVTRAVTTLVANPAEARLLPPKIYFPKLSARLTIGNPAIPVAGQTIRFTVGTTVLCSAVTDANGNASCSGSLSGDLKVILHLGYNAIFDGDANLLPTQDHGPLFTL